MNLKYNGMLTFKIKNREALGNFLAVQWLRFGAFTAVGLGSISGWGANIPQAAPHGQKKKREALAF